MDKIYNNINRLAADLFKELRGVRRYLHKHPELGRQEYQTSKYLRDKLDEIGNFKITMVGSTGFVADLIQSADSPWIALRADMDALPIQDEKNVPYKSINNNICHACGHDFHSTVVLGLAHILYKLKSQINGNVRFIFQHAEEPIPGGALDFVNQNMLENIDCILGLHAQPDLKTGTIGLIPGWNSAQSIHWKIKIVGKAGHSSRPQNTIDPIFIGVQILNELYAALYRKLNPNKPFVFAAGKIKSGDSYNSIPETFSTEGTLRVTDGQIRDELLKYIENCVKQISKNWGAKHQIEFNIGSPPVNNDKDKTKIFKRYLKQIIGDSNLIDIERSMGGEDFGYYQTVIPGVFLKFGVGDDEKNYPVHHSKFDIDEKAITFAVSVLGFLVIKFFNERANEN